MSTKIQIIGGGFQDVLGNVLANGYVLFTLSQDAQVNGNTQIAAGYTVKVLLDSNGNVITSPIQSIWPNDALSPVGTFYIVSVYKSNGQLVWGPNAQQVLSIPSPYNIGLWIPASVNTGSGGGGGGGGNINPGNANQIAFYQTTGSTISSSQLTTDNTFSNLTVPNLLTSAKDISFSTHSANRIPSADSELVQSLTESEVAGGGWNLGQSGGWSVSKNTNDLMVSAQRGITQNKAGVFTKQAIGDTAGIYSYTLADGGVTAGSDEGVTGCTLQVLENEGYFHGHVTGSGGTGAQQPTLAHDSGNAWTTDGAFLLNISKGTLSGNMTGSSTGVSLDLGSGSVSTFLNSLPVSTTLSISSAIGVSVGAISNPGVAANNPTSTTLLVNLAKIGGTFHSFSVNDVVSIAGINYPEQSVILAASSPVVVGSGQQQTLTMKLRNPNTQAIIFKGGIQGQYISFDANLALSGMRSSYYAFGSLTGSDLIYGLQAVGSLEGKFLPQMGNEAATSTGANSGFHLYPGAEVVANTDIGFLPQLEQNGVTWSVNDNVENPHYPVYGGSALFVNRFQQTPTNGGFGSATAYFLMNGPGTGGGNAYGLRLQNAYGLDNPTEVANYQGSGGPLLAPTGIGILGAFNHNIYMQQAPDTGSVLFVQDNDAANTNFHSVISMNYASGGNLFFLASQGRWAVDGSFDAQGGFLSNHVPGSNGTFTTVDGKTVTVSGGLITGIV